MTKRMIAAAALSFGMALMGCEEATRTFTPPLGDSIPQDDATIGAPTVDVVAATPEECATGGSTILRFRDANQNQRLDEEEIVLARTPICQGRDGQNGRDGEDGLNGQDGQNGSDGQNGADGKDGVDGQDGIDGKDGADGQDGTDGKDGVDGRDIQYAMGAIGPAVAGKSYSACHHDYLYVPHATEPARGWLFLRHQGNASEESGSTSSGFDVQHVDIPHFDLTSKKGKTTYCRLHYDAALGTLDFEVVDSGDGLRGLTGRIALR